MAGNLPCLKLILGGGAHRRSFAHPLEVQVRQHPVRPESTAIQIVQESGGERSRGGEPRVYLRERNAATSEPSAGSRCIAETKALDWAATQRRPACRAGSPGRGPRSRHESRDKLMAYLWPESDDERARHVLNLLLIAQRRQSSGRMDSSWARKRFGLKPRRGLERPLDAFEARARRRPTPAEGSVALTSVPFPSMVSSPQAPPPKNFPEKIKTRCAGPMHERDFRVARPVIQSAIHLTGHARPPRRCIGSRRSTGGDAG
jgi:hypothetical protein